MRLLTSVFAWIAMPIVALDTYAADAASGNAMSIVRNGEQASITGAPTNFVGAARIDPLFPVRTPSRVSAGYVTFQPGARSMWHTHPLGQTLVVTAGSGWVQEAGGEKHSIKPGDVIWTPPGVKHWHGATSTTGMTHMAIQESLDGKNVEWMEPVTAQQYEALR
jgi:quercetin dioxygenase-like cupin family protein